MMKISFPIVLVVLILSSCARSNNYGLSIEQWVGTTEAYFIQGWGKPDNTDASGKSTIYTYYENGGAPNGCTTTFEIVDEYVESFDYAGKGCVGDFNTVRHSSGKYRER